jgi:putative FmdB family regulatory protein
VPIYEYECTSCGERFELLVLGSEPPACPSCGSRALERLLSLPAIGSEGTRGRSRAEAKRRRRSRQQELHASEHDATVDHHDDH